MKTNFKISKKQKKMIKIVKSAKRNIAKNKKK